MLLFFVLSVWYSVTRATLPRRVFIVLLEGVNSTKQRDKKTHVHHNLAFFSKETHSWHGLSIQRTYRTVAASCPAKQNYLGLFLGERIGKRIGGVMFWVDFEESWGGVFCAVHDDYTSNKHISDSSFCCVKMQHSVGSLFLNHKTRHHASTLRPSADEQTLGNALCLLWPAACRVPARDILSLSLSLASFLRVVLLL